MADGNVARGMAYGLPIALAIWAIIAAVICFA